jgi:CRISPR-associated protein Cas1
MLNYGYGILYGNVWGAILNAGLEPFAGFLHVDRPGKPSLVLDLVEEFRQPVVDRAILSAVNLGINVRMENGLLDRESREMVGARVCDRLVSAERHQGKEYQLRSIIQMQACGWRIPN